MGIEPFSNLVAFADISIHGELCAPVEPRPVCVSLRGRFPDTAQSGQMPLSETARLVVPAPCLALFEWPKSLFGNGLRTKRMRVAH